MDCWRISALVACLLIASVSPSLANFVADPGFESCPTNPPPPGWSGTGACELDSAHGKLVGRIRGNEYPLAEHTNDRWHHVRFLILGRRHIPNYSKSVYRNIRG